MLLRAFLSLALLSSASLTYAAGPAITVYKTRTCGCCGKWVDHLRANGFTPEVKEVLNTADARKQYGVPDSMVSCHTAVVNGYAVEGHVPAADIHRMLKERPKAKGIAVPGMPHGSPGMETGRKDAYSVLLFQQDGRTSVFQKYPGN